MTATAYAKVGRERFEAAVRRSLPLKKMERVMAAYAFSKGAHRGINRKDGVTRYFEHPKSVTWILIQAGLGGDWRTLVLALLHDVLEDTHLLSPKRIEINFGVKVRVGVEDISKRPDESHEQYSKRLLNTDVDWRVLLVKLADRVHNLRTLSACTPEQQAKKLAETRELYLPRLEFIEKRVPRRYRPVAHQLCEEIRTACV
jgi:GTP diphosphokinase / guanosine-3',5'-bis(diphosphate) 3'-diphosphatase